MKNPLILDIGCGPGAQTLCLAGALDAQIIAVDIHQDFLQRAETLLGETLRWHANYE